MVGEKKNVGVITLNRPKALNALCKGLMTEVAKALDVFESDKGVGAIIITGKSKVTLTERWACLLEFELFSMNL